MKYRFSKLKTDIKGQEKIFKLKTVALITYSYCYILSFFTNKLNKNILNLAFQDSRILDNTIILEYLIENNLKFDSIIFNVNQSHIKVNNFSHLKKYAPL